MNTPGRTNLSERIGLGILVAMLVAGIVALLAPELVRLALLHTL